MKKEENIIEYKLPKLIKTGILALDFCLKGIDENSVIQLVGESGSGKTLISVQMAYNFCKENKNVIYVDTSNSLNQGIINQMNLNEYFGNKFQYIRESSFSKVEQQLDILIQNNNISLIIIDSFPELINEGYLNLESSGIKIDNNNTNYLSRPSALFVQKYKAISSRKNIVLVLINQYRNKINPQVGTIKKRFGVKILDYASDIILEIEKIQNKSKYLEFVKIFKNSNYGCTNQINVIKSKSIMPNTKIPIFLTYGKGITILEYYIYFLVKTKEIVLNGTYYTYEKFQIKENGINNFIKIFKEKNIDLSIYNDLIIKFYTNLISN